MSATIRAGRVDEEEALCALFGELDAFHAASRPELFRSFDGPARSRAQIETWIAGPDSTILVAEAGDLVGLSLIIPRAASPFAGAVPRRIAVIDNLVVRADWRDRGIGEALLEASVAWARAHGSSHVELGVHAVNRHARRFYERHGFATSVHWMMRAI
ncbi:MAG: GNAT family N-acetyltransferase [Alphaproteobacteria bacterium]|nr:GNAT family N-acetyltransferase [Alphaproteobacteria bacterium]